MTFLSIIENYGGFGILTPKLRITDLPIFTIEITEVSVFFLRMVGNTESAQFDIYQVLRSHLPPNYLVSGSFSISF